MITNCFSFHYSMTAAANAPSSPPNQSNYHLFFKKWVFSQTSNGMHVFTLGFEPRTPYSTPGDFYSFLHEKLTALVLFLLKGLPH